jgi:hypothetical protein
MHSKHNTHQYLELPGQDSEMLFYIRRGTLAKGQLLLVRSSHIPQTPYSDF